MMHIHPSMKLTLRFLLNYSSAFIIYTFFLLALFQSPILRSAILFYRGIALSAIAFVLVILVKSLPLTKLSAALKPSWSEWVSATIASASLHFCFFVVVPVTIDRSVTTFLLVQMAKINQNTDKVITKESLKETFLRTYVESNDAIGRRMQEQIVSGNVTTVYSDNTSSLEFKITKQGISFVHFARRVGELFAVSDTVLR